MSIWSSVDCELLPVLATGADRSVVNIDVATATSWSDDIRLSVTSEGASGLDVDVLLGADNADMLASRLQVAVARIYARRALSATAAKESTE